MSTRVRITREKIVEDAFGLIRERGWEALSARSLAARMNCSTQPLLYHFKSVEAILDAVYQRVDAYHTEYILGVGEEEQADMLGIGLRYIRFAAREPYLFRFLFQSNRFQGRSLEDLLAAPETAPLLAPLGMAPSEARKTFSLLFAAVHGYASLLANNAMEEDDGAIEEALTRLGEALLRPEGEK